VTVLRLANCRLWGTGTKQERLCAVQLGSGSRKINNVSKAEARPLCSCQGGAEAEAC